jgi:mono/diheme cytochrome c family protein
LPYEKDPLPVVERYSFRVKDQCSSWVHSHITGFEYCASPKIDLALGGPVRTPPAGAGAKESGTASASAAPSFSLAEGPTDKDALIKHGADVYNNVCSACHGPQGAGVPGAFPPLAGSGAFYGDARKHAGIIVHGLSGAISVQGQAFNGAMPPQGAALTDYDIAAVATYERNSWGNNDGIVMPADVAAIR